MLLVPCRKKLLQRDAVLKRCWNKTTEQHVLLSHMLVFEDATSLNTDVFLKKYSVWETEEIFTSCFMYV